ncbi:TOBE domain-containing protein [Arcobacter cryaerophilus gv. pseudocryaerophilus]
MVEIFCKLVLVKSFIIIQQDLYCANFLGKISQISDNEYIRPENIKICSNGKIEAIIKDIIFYGSFYEVTVVVNNKDLLVYSC